MSNCVATGCCCCYEGCDCDNIVCCFVSQGDCLCLRSGCCLAANTPSRGCGMTTDKEAGECCKIGCFCCDYGLIAPQTLCAGADQCLCSYRVRSCPTNQYYMKDCVCACYFLQCAPTCGCCVSQPDCPALEDLRKGEFRYPKPEAMAR